MKARSMLLTIVVCFIAFAVSYAQNPHMGTWKLNEAKSKIPAGMMKNTTVTYAEEGDSVKVTTDGTLGDKPVNTADSRSYTKVDDRTLTLDNKKDGKVTTTGRIVVAADGKSRTLTVSGKDSAGKKVTSKAVYDKQ